MTTPVTRQQPSRRAVRAIVLLAAFASLVVSAPAHAAESCGRQVIDDWYDGRIDGTYELHCYDDAIEQLPRDLEDYSSAPEDIQRALQSRMRGQKAPPNRDPAPTDTRPDETPPAQPPGEDPPRTTPNPEPPDSPPTDTVAIPTDTGSSASSVPVPLLILAGLALLLVAGGSAGYVIRRFQSRRIPPPAV